MALISCPECGKEISDKAIACPHCGYPMNQSHDETRGARSGNKKINITQDEAAIIDITQSSGKLSAVKWYNDSYNCGLKKAKETVEEVLEMHNIPPYPESVNAGGNGCSIIVLIGISLTLGAMLLV